MSAPPRHFDWRTRELLLTLEILVSGWRINIFQYDFLSLSGFAQLIMAFEYGCRRLDTHQYTQSTNTNGIAILPKIAVAERMEAEPTTGRRIEVGLPV